MDLLFGFLGIFFSFSIILKFMQRVLELNNNTQQADFRFKNGTVYVLLKGVPIVDSTNKVSFSFTNMIRAFNNADKLTYDLLILKNFNN